MSEEQEPDLSLGDVEFLTTVRDVCDSPEKYDGTDEGAAPATTPVLQRETTLSKRQVKYRMYRADDSQESRGFAQDGMGLIETHSAQLHETGWSPRSCEITERGREVLDEVLDDLNPGGGAGPQSDVVMERINRLEEDMEEVGEVKQGIERLDNQIATLAETVEELSDTIESFEESEHGALGPEVKEKFDTVTNAMIAYNNIFQFMLDVDTAAFNPSGDMDITPERVAQEREKVQSQLEASTVEAASETIEKHRTE